MSAAFNPSPVTAEHIRRAREVTGHVLAFVVPASIPVVGTGTPVKLDVFEVRVPSRFPGSPDRTLGRGATPEAALESAEHHRG